MGSGINGNIAENVKGMLQGKPLPLWEVELMET
jgi:hypothetical protein